jgi:hypothetical protein
MRFAHGPLRSKGKRMSQESHSGGARGIFSWLRRRRTVTKIERASGTRMTYSTNISATNPWHAVVVTTGKSCCQASIGARHTRFLSKEAPPLPLAGCTQPKHCLCKYKHFTDRRAGPRRFTDSERFKNALSQPSSVRLTIDDRRGTAGRRATDGR